jgi:hypothetical protein
MRPVVGGVAHIKWPREENEMDTNTHDDDGVAVDWRNAPSMTLQELMRAAAADTAATELTLIWGEGERWYVFDADGDLTDEQYSALHNGQIT